MYGSPPPHHLDQRDGVTVCAIVFGLRVGLEAPRATMECARARRGRRRGPIAPSTIDGHATGSVRCVGWRAGAPRWPSSSVAHSASR